MTLGHVAYYFTKSKARSTIDVHAAELQPALINGRLAPDVVLRFEEVNSSVVLAAINAERLAAQQDLAVLRSVERIHEPRRFGQPERTANRVEFNLEDAEGSFTEEYARGTRVQDELNAES